jgi:hypothetical protein
MLVMNLTAFILAGGMGRRIRAITSLPKCMISINDKPVLFHWIDSLSEICEEIYISLFYRGDHISNMIYERYPQTDKLRIICDGTEGQWAHVGHMVQQAQTEAIAIILADNYWEGFEKGEEGITQLKDILMLPQGKAATIAMIPKINSSAATDGDPVWGGIITIRKAVLSMLIPIFKPIETISDTILPFVQRHYKTSLVSIPGLYLDIGTLYNLERLQAKGCNVGV